MDRVFGKLEFAQNSLSGIVFDNNRRPVASIDVELLGDFERLARTARTNGSGLYLFNNLPAGIYYLRVRVSGTPFMEAKERIQLGTTNRNQNGRVTGSESLQHNFYLQPARRDESPRINEVVFAQEVPARARTHYDSGVLSLRNEDTDNASRSFQAALVEFPAYFLANIELGKIYFDKEEFGKAANLYEKACEVNKSSFAAFWGLALSYEKLARNQAALEAVTSAIEINVRSVEAHLLQGIILRELQKNNAALESMLNAKRIGKNAYPEVHWNLGLLYYYNFGNPGLAADELELFISAIPKNERAQNREKIDEVKNLIAQMRKQEK